MASYQVIAALVQAKKANGSYVHVDEGGFLPDDMDEEQLQQLIASEMVVEADPPEDGAEDAAPAKKATPKKAATKATSRGRSRK